jgi:hypothetical protein
MVQGGGVQQSGPSPEIVIGLHAEPVPLGVKVMLQFITPGGKVTVTVPDTTAGLAAMLVNVSGLGLVTIDVDPGAETVTVVLVPFKFCTTV